jgi:pimeloyl-ACP methyl ester carboxylesterase
LAAASDPVAAIRGLFPHSRAVVMPDAGHSGPMEQPALFESTLRDFERSI